MNEERKKARDIINNSTLEEFKDLIAHVRVSDDDLPILELRFIRGWPIGKIAQEQFMSEEKVKTIIRRMYNKIARLI